MKFTKTLALAALAATTLLGGNFTLSAQDATNSTPAPAGPATRAKRLTVEQIIKELGLTEEVGTKFKAAWDDRSTQMRAIRSDSSLSADDKRQKSKAILDTFQTKVKEILTPEQLEKLKKLIPGNVRRAPLAAPAQN